MLLTQWMLSAALATAPVIGAELNTLTPAEESAGWQLLFDGKTMKGWRDPARLTPAGDAWTIEDGCLKAMPHPRITEDLVVDQTFRDFELTFEWRISPGGNSGIKYGIQGFVFLENKKMKKGVPFEEVVANEMANHLSEREKMAPGEKAQEYVISFEYQVIDNERHADAKRGPLYQSGALYSMVPATQDVTKPVGEFNQSRLVVRGDHVEHWLNGTKVVDASLDSEAVKDGVSKRWKNVPLVYDLLVNRPRKDCPFSLQNHGDAAWFRNLKIRRL